MAPAAGRHTELGELVIVHVVLQRQDCLLLDLKRKPNLIDYNKIDEH